MAYSLRIPLRSKTTTVTIPKRIMVPRSGCLYSNPRNGTMTRPGRTKPQTKVETVPPKRMRDPKRAPQAARVSSNGILANSAGCMPKIQRWAPLR